jgi:hypothetical protein
MNEEKQRIAIAKACGWEQFSPDKDPDCWYQPGWRLVVKTKDLPDYLNDLNAMHEAVKSVTIRSQQHYIAALRNICAVAGNWPEEATAAQRAEAFLKTIGKWEDDK